MRIEYIRPGKYMHVYEEDFLSLDESCLRTHKVLPEDVSVALGNALFSQGLVAAGERVGIIDKTYLFEEPFNLLEFRRADGSLLGYYSDIGEPVTRLGEDLFQMTDLFLDVWLSPDGRLLELDWDEFEEAVQGQVISPAQADLARKAVRRIVDETAEGIYPLRYTASEENQK